ncbi:hypothetical protein DVH24_041396 [Malus domestica]|uniref:Uncharacterized protein n=1 Tax=Malus domestica TaxID=3750 RepID=A0A498IBB6_MALDO|nr:hypothetical protein DVH24_041396 [Malus domestica]
MALSRPVATSQPSPPLATAWPPPPLATTTGLSFDISMDHGLHPLCATTALDSSEISPLSLVRSGVDTTLDLSQKAEKGMIRNELECSFYTPVCLLNYCSRPMWDFNAQNVYPRELLLVNHLWDLELT